MRYTLGLNLGLKLVGQFTHAVLVFVILISLELELLDAALSLLEGFEGLRCLALDRSKLNLKLTDARLKLSHGITSSLGSNLISLSKSLLKFSDLRLKGTLALLLSVRVLLFSS